MLSPQPLVPQNVTLFGNEAVANVISEVNMRSYRACLGGSVG